MPKLKHTSSSHAVSLTKRRKKNKQERQGDLPRCQEHSRRECDAEAHRSACRDPVRRQQEQERNTAARRRVRLEDPERRREEQDRDTAARRQVRMEDTERRTEEQQRDTAARRQARMEDMERRTEEQQRDTASRWQVRLNDPERRLEEQEQDTVAHRVARRDHVTRMDEQQSDQQRRREARADPEYRATEQQTTNTRRQQVREGRQASFRALNYQVDNFVNTTSVGVLHVKSQNCGALKFNKETDGLCCSKGNVKLDTFPQLQPFLQHLYEGTDSEGKHFYQIYKNITVLFK